MKKLAVLFIICVLIFTSCTKEDSSEDWVKIFYSQDDYDNQIEINPMDSIHTNDLNYVNLYLKVQTESIDDLNIIIVNNNDELLNITNRAPGALIRSSYPIGSSYHIFYDIADYYIEEEYDSPKLRIQTEKMQIDYPIKTLK